ncbi:uncharacterized protein BX664DRAFT_358263 [Halteromyces radiatus]|uniref:uncharacterized protein n=1 Tax=Halteromyces radiatus TaxID=101107 RepID=UPI0022202824|nr:uncharacterized protein BX664DRAFT_358263 [Halteromyces radiatus]KAI8093888.1 hypothetical protein BX664DRAFT_358263 [Halteromyces radiatus]
MVKNSTFQPDSLDTSPLNVFALPQEILTTLVPLNDAETGSVVDDVVHKQEQLNLANLEKLRLQQQQNDIEQPDVLTCGTCQQSFSDRLDHRQHFGTDWHRYNIKRKLVFDQPPVSLNEFEDMLADLSDSLSGSDTEQEESSDDDMEENGSTMRVLETIGEEDKVQNLVGKQQLALDEAQAIEDQVTASTTQWISSTPLQKKYASVTWFKVPSLTCIPFHLGIYRVLLESKKNISSVDAIQRLQQSSDHGKQTRLWTLLMMGGGHFAGAIIDVNQSKGLMEQQLNKQVHIHTHKTFHRYTTRRKQGGSQSANDSGKGKANSAGAQIRRYNEMALQQDIRELLDQWKKYIDQSEMVFIHAPSGNKKIIYGYDNAVLRKDDPKIHNIPFTTRRPTLNELRRIYLELTTLKVVQVDEQAIQEHQQRLKEKETRLRERLEKVKTSNVKKQPPSSDPVLEKFLVLVKQGKVNVVQSYLDKHPDLPVVERLPDSLMSEYGRYPTVLHIAASQGHSKVVSMLLRDVGANPTIKNDIGKTAYEVAKDKMTRNVFRRCMCDLPDRWPWLVDARVPSPLTIEDEKEQLEKDRKKKAKEDERKRLMELERQQKEDARLAKEEAELLEQRSKNNKKKGQMLDPMARALRDNQVNVANMSPEARMRLEREKRARAAEARLKKK